MEKIIDMLMENKLFEKPLIRILIYLITFIFSLLILYIIIENIFYNKYNVSDANAWLLWSISFMLFLLTLIWLAKWWKDKMVWDYENNIIEFIKENKVEKYDDLYKELLGEVDENWLSKEEKETLQKEKKKIRTICRKLKDEKIIDFEKWWKKFEYLEK